MLGLAVGLMVASLAVDAGVELGGLLFWLAFNSTFVILVLLGSGLPPGPSGPVGTTGRRRHPPRRPRLLRGQPLLGRHRAAIANAYGVAGAAALGVFAALYWARDRLPEWRVLEWLGDITYPLYMVHALNGYLILRVVWLETGNYYVAVAVAFASALGHWPPSSTASSTGPPTISAGVSPNGCGPEAAAARPLPSSARHGRPRPNPGRTRRVSR